MPPAAPRPEPADGERRARHDQRRRGRRPVGRRGQRQDRRLALGTRRGRGPLPGRAQCRPHPGDRRPDLQAEPVAVRGGATRQAVDHRQRRGDRPVGPARRDRDPARERRRGRPGQSADRRERAVDPAVARRARPGARAGTRRQQHRHRGDRHDRPRDRAGLRGQGRAPGGPGVRPGCARPARAPDRRAAPASQCLAARRSATSRSKRRL